MKKQILKMLGVVLVVGVGLTAGGRTEAKSGKATWIHAAKVHAVLKTKADPKFVAHFSYEDLEFIADQGEKGIKAVLVANDLILDTFMTAEEITEEAMLGMGFKGKDHFKMSVVLEKACQGRIVELENNPTEPYSPQGNNPTEPYRPQGNNPTEPY